MVRQALMNLAVKRTTIIVSVIILVVLSVRARAGAQQEPAADQYSGDFFSRSTLTGDWDGYRNDLAAKGISLDMNVTQIEQGVVSGGKSETWEYRSRRSYRQA